MWGELSLWASFARFSESLYQENSDVLHFQQALAICSTNAKALYCCKTPPHLVHWAVPPVQCLNHLSMLIKYTVATLTGLQKGGGVLLLYLPDTYAQQHDGCLRHKKHRSMFSCNNTLYLINFQQTEHYPWSLSLWSRQRNKCAVCTPACTPNQWTTAPSGGSKVKQSQLLLTSGFSFDLLERWEGR